jgi:uncharacterized protein YbjT (DUF2867 family)
MTAIVIGATGLVGSHLIDQLIKDERFHRIVVLTRRSLGNQHAKLIEHLVDFSNPKEWKHLVSGDVLFSNLGTTLKKAGSKGAQFTIDYTYQYITAKAAAENGVSNYVLVSAAYSSPDARVFYSRMKGELDRDVQKLSFQHISIIRPGFIDGDRKEQRLGEKLMLPVLRFLYHIPGLKTLQPVHAATIATAMINAAFYHPDRVNFYELRDVFRLAKTDVYAAQ